MKSFLKGYKKAVGVIGKGNTILILSIVYWAVLPVFSLILNFKRASLRGSTWRTKEADFFNSHEQQF